MSADLRIEKFVALWPVSPFRQDAQHAWQITQRAAELVGAALSALDDGYGREGDIAVHRTATIENGWSMCTGTNSVEVPRITRPSTIDFVAAAPT